MEGRESFEDAVTREIHEEAGLKDVSIVPGFSRLIHWEAGETRYDYKVFLVETGYTNNIMLSDEIVEHDSFRWADENETMKLLTHIDNKKVFAEAIEWLSKNG